MWWLRYKRTGLLVIGVGALGLVGAGFVIQEVYRLNPCPLCIFQRLLYIVFGVTALLGAAMPRGHKGFGLMLAGISLAGIATSIYQSFMQAFPGVINECSYTDPNLIERLVDWLGMQYPMLFMATGFCGSKEWIFLGLSMANWSLVCFTVLGMLSLALTGWILKKYQSGR